ncbi:hypothetical protein TALC_01261 [Thermoplasmatales archaeon BRNA1]|nr:hypothetical protein TALC_01261 [Thermoplasmatales archaeon BRNA1]
MDTDGLYDIINGNLSAILMLAAGLVAFLIVYEYRKDDEGGYYKLSVLIGFILGICLMFFGVTRYEGWSSFDAALIVLSGFVLFIRPLRDVPFALLLAILAMAWMYVFLGGLSGDLEILSEGYPRIILSVVVGAVVYMVFNFLEKLTQLVGKILNCWPILLILGSVCIIEGSLLLADAPSLINYYYDWKNEN